MTAWILTAGMLVMGGIAAAYGALMLISPRRWGSLLDNASFADRWSSSRSSTNDQGSGAQIRIAGAVISVVGTFFVVTVLHGLLTSGKSSHMVPAPPVGYPNRHVFSWIDLAAPGLATVAGIYLIAFPEQFLRWSAMRMRPPREINPKALPLLKFFMRVMGGLSLLGGITGIVRWIRVAL
jgi:hypothetical protein